MNSPQPTIRSGHKIPLLDGSNDHLVFSREHWNQIIMVANLILANPTWIVTDHGLILDVGSGAGGFPWQKPNKELDPTVAVEKDTFVYISQNNALCTNTTVIDLVSLSAEISYAGIWQAIKDVPAQVVVSGVTKYNIPVAALPGATGTPAGSPLKGDMDGVNVFWKWWSGASSCG